MPLEPEPEPEPTAGAPAAICAELLVGVDEDMLEYVVGTVLDDGELLNRADLTEFVAPLLLDAEICEEEDAAEALAAQLCGRLAGVGAAAAEEEPVLLTKSVTVAAGAKEQEERIHREISMTTMQLVTDGGRVNSTIWVFTLSDEGLLSDKQLRELLKNRKRDNKKYARDTRLEKASAERRNALIEALRTRPVVLHRDVSKMIHFVSKTRNFALKMMNFTGDLRDHPRHLPRRCDHGP